MSATAEVGGPGRIFLVEHVSWGTIDLITLGSETYLKAPKAYWAARSKLKPRAGAGGAVRRPVAEGSDLARA
jgi:hypothetical protein